MHPLPQTRQLPTLRHHVPPQLQLGLPQRVEALSMGAQLSTDLRHITVGTGRQHAGRGSVGTGEGDLLAEAVYLVLSKII